MLLFISGQPGRPQLRIKTSHRTIIWAFGKYLFRKAMQVHKARRAGPVRQVRKVIRERQDKRAILAARVILDRRGRPDPLGQLVRQGLVGRLDPQDRPALRGRSERRDLQALQFTRVRFVCRRNRGPMANVVAADAQFHRLVKTLGPAWRLRKLDLAKGPVILAVRHTRHNLAAAASAHLDSHSARPCSDEKSARCLDAKLPIISNSHAPSYPSSYPRKYGDVALVMSGFNQ